MFENEKVIETKTCKHCGVSFDITDKDLEFYEKISPVFSNFNPGVKKETPGLKLLENGKVKYLIPTPTLCPDCRQQRRLSFRNERKLYKRKCDFSGKEIVSIYSPDKPYKVYDQEVWWSDKWDALDYQREFDFKKSFFEQFEELMREVPTQNLVGANNENSQYINLTADSKNCYIVIESSNNEDCYYGYWLQKCNNCVDVSFSHECSECYFIQDCYSCHNIMFSNNCENSKNSYFLENCHGCEYCLGCVNLNNKQYYILNKSYSREEYFKISQKMDFKYLKDKFEKLSKSSIKKYGYIKMAQNSSGDYMNGVKNCIHCFHAYEAEDCKYGEHVWRNAKDLMDVSTVGRDANLVYETINTGINVSNDLFCIICWGSSNLIYSFSCFNSSNLFGCVGLKNKSYCILNKQYTKEEYETLVPKIISHMMKTGEWGEFFPSSLSPFGYNETVAEEYYPINPPVLTDIPLNKGDSQNGVEAGGLSYIDREGNTYKTIEEAISFCHSELDSESLKTKNFNQRKDPDPDLGTGGQLIHGKIFNWSDYEAPFPKVEKIIPASKLPENIAEIPDDILNRAIECEVSKKPFRIIKEELDFYRKHNLPIPRRHPDQRHLDRMKLRNPRKLYTRICDCPTCEENHKNIGKFKEEDFALNKKTGKKGLKIQTTYPPERPEIVYCENCYNKEVY